MYSNAGAESARSTLAYFERLRAFSLHQANLSFNARKPLRVIGFRSVSEYNSYRIRPAADAYYAGTEDGDYIVMPALRAGNINVAAHEYAHFLIHRSGLSLPVWMNEGLADVFSTVRIGERGCSVGTDLPERSHLLRNHAGMLLRELVAPGAGPPARSDRARTGLFYAQSWALVHMLMLSREYAPRFPVLIAELASGAPGAKALTSVYGRSLDAIETDLRAYVSVRRFTPVSLRGLAAPITASETFRLSSFASRSMLADVLFATGDLERAEGLYRELANDSPDSADLSAALGSIAFRRGPPRERAPRMAASR